MRKQIKPGYSCYLIFLMMMAAISSCKNQATRAITPQPSAEAVEAPAHNRCLVTGRIITIDQNLEMDDTGSICSKFPCHAWVQLVSVSECGNGISKPVYQNDSIPVFFIFSLSPTKEIWPNRSPSYPGLKNGSVFTAYIEQRILPGNDVVYRIYGYRKH